MSFTSEQVRTQLAAMGYHNVPDAAVAQFATKLTEQAKRRQVSEELEADEKDDNTAHLDDGTDSDDESLDGQHRQHSRRSDSPLSRRLQYSGHLSLRAARPPLPPSNRSLLAYRQRPRTPLPSVRNTVVSATPRQPLHIADNRSPAHIAQQSQLSRQAEEEQCEEEGEYTTTTEWVGRSDKENVATLVNIQRGLAKVLAERGIASPYKPTHAPHHTTPPLPATAAVVLSPASSYRSSASRPSSPLSSSFMSSQSDLSLSTVSSIYTTAVAAPLAGVRALQLRVDERVRGVARGYGQGGFRKADVVNRYQQYRAEWERSSFLHRRQHGK